MNVIMMLIDFILHIDSHLGNLIHTYGSLIYLLLFLIIFIETGVVIMPFLPGDSLLFAAGAFAAIGELNIALLCILLFSAAIIGDTTNYHIGKFLSNRLQEGNHKLVKKEYLDKTNSYYEKYGVKTIIIARFVPIVRTFSPFVAGVGHMDFKTFIKFDLFGGFLWVSLMTLSGYFFGNISFIADHFSLVVLVIIFISLLPAIIEIVKYKFNSTEELV